MESLEEQYTELTFVIKFLHKRYNGSRELAILKTINILGDERSKIADQIIERL